MDENLLENTPREIIDILVSYLDVATLASLARTSRNWYNLLQDVLYKIAVTYTFCFNRAEISVIQWAAMDIKYRKDTFTALIRKKANIHARYPSGDSLLHMVSAQGDKDAVKLLIKSGLSPTLTTFGRTALQTAAEGGHVKVIKYLLYEFFGEWRISDFHAATCCAVAGGHETALRLLLQHVDVSQPCQYLGMPFVTHAAERGSIAIVRLLISQGAELAPIALNIAAENGRQDLVKEMLSQCETNIAEREITWRTPLHGAARNGYANVARTLLAHGADPNAKDLDGNTPLYLAKIFQHNAVVDILAPITEDDTLIEHYFS